MQQNGYDVKAVRNIDPRLQDLEILRIADSEKRMVITMDKDFGQYVFYSGFAHAGVLILRLEDATGDKKAKVVKEIIELYADQIYGNFCVYQKEKFRIRSG